MSSLHLELPADILNYMCAAAVASISGVAVSIACTIGHRENTRKKDKSQRSKRGKKSQRSLRKKKGPAPAAPAPGPMTPVTPVSPASPTGAGAGASKEKSNRGKKEGSARAKKSAEKPKKESSQREKKPDPPKEEAEKPKELEKPAESVAKPPPKVISEYGVVPEKDPAAMAEIAAKQGEEKPESIMVLDGNIAGAEKRLFGADAEAAAAEAKKQADVEKNKPKDAAAEQGSQYLK